MNNRFKRFVASLLTVVMLISMLPASAMANATDDPTAATGTIPVLNEEPATEPSEETPEEPSEEPSEEPTEEPSEEPTEEPSEEPSEEPTEETTEETTEEPTEEATEEPVGDTAENSGSAPVFQFNGYKTLEDFGISTTSTFSMRKSNPASGYLNPQTIRPTSSYYGYRWICNWGGYVYPFTASFTLDENYMPQNSVYIAIANYDCDEIGSTHSSEYDQVYINGHCVGVLTGNNNTSNTTLLKVDRSYLQPGANSITIRVGIRIKEAGSKYWGDPVGAVYADDPYDQWWLRVDDIQVLCDGGSTEGRPDVFRVNLTRAELSGNDVHCYVTTKVEDSKNRTFSLEYALYDWSHEESPTYGQIIADDFATIRNNNYNHEGTLTMPVNSMSGTYTAVVYLKERKNGIDSILAYDEESFEYETGIAPAFDIQNLTATPATLEWTSGPVGINLSADIDVNAGLSNLVFRITDTIQAPASVDKNGHVTGKLELTENGFYTVELHYIKDGKNYKKTTTIEINNIIESDNEILATGIYFDKSYKSGTFSGYCSTFTFWVTTPTTTKEVYVYRNNQVLNNGKPLDIKSSELLDNNTRRYKLNVYIGEGIHSIRFRTKDGSSEKTTVFCGISDTADITKFAYKSGIQLRSWPSANSYVAMTLPLGAEVVVCGEIDVSANEGYDYIRYNGAYYFVRKGVLSDAADDKEFREFVKTVSNTYYNTFYDHNKYYYLSSDVKIDWDKGGFFGSRQDNPYSTYEKDSQYNIQQIQAMLIDGIQQKADTINIKNINISNYTEGMGLNPITGAWEVNGRAVISQQQYNADVEAALLKAEQALTATLVNSLADVALVYFGKGKAPDTAYKLVDITTAVVEDAMKAYTDAAYKNITAMLQNNYRALMSQALLDMYDNIDRQMTADYRALHAELSAKSNLTPDEKLLKEQLDTLIKALDKAKADWARTTPADIDSICLQAAEEYVQAIGLEVYPVLSEDEITRYVVVEVVTSLILNTLDSFIEVDSWLSNLIKDCIKNSIDVVVEDLNSDGAFGTGELVTSICHYFTNILLDKGNFENLLLNFYKGSSTHKNMFPLDKLNSQLNDINAKLEKLRSQKNDYNNRIAQRKAEGKAVRPMDKNNIQKYNTQINKAEANKASIEQQIRNENIVSVLVQDVIQLASDTLTLAKEAAGLGDVADNEVFYAYIANYMVHAMDAAEVRRNSLNNGTYKKMKNHSYIDDAPVPELKDFVNRVYAVYEQDMIGHSAYTTLAAGWHYQSSGEKFMDWLEEKDRIQADMKDKMGGWYILTWLGYQELLEATAFFGGISTSEYLETLDKEHQKVWKAGTWNGYNFRDSYSRNGILTVISSEFIYEKIGASAKKVELPDKFKSIN